MGVQAARGSGREKIKLKLHVHRHEWKKEIYTTTKSTLLDTRYFYIFDVFIKKTSSIDHFKRKTSSIV